MKFVTLFAVLFVSCYDVGCKTSTGKCSTSTDLDWISYWLQHPSTFSSRKAVTLRHPPPFFWCFFLNCLKAGLLKTPISPLSLCLLYLCCVCPQAALCPSSPLSVSGPVRLASVLHFSSLTSHPSVNEILPNNPSFLLCSGLKPKFMTLFFFLSRKQILLKQRTFNILLHTYDIHKTYSRSHICRG